MLENVRFPNLTTSTSLCENQLQPQNSKNIVMEGGSTKANSELRIITLELLQRVKLLRQQYLLLRSDVLYLCHEMNLARQWVVKNFRAVMSSRMQERTSQKVRVEKLSQILT